MKISRIESGRMGAIALNSDPVKKKAAAQKAVATIRASKPDFYSTMGKLSALKKKERKAESIKNA